MADSPNGSALSRILQPLSRRKFFSFSAAALASSAVPAMAAVSAVPAASNQFEEYQQFEAAMKIAFDPARYVDYMTAHGEDCFMIHRAGESRMYRCWLIQFDQRGNCDSFLEELNRRGWAYDSLPGEKLYEAERRVTAFRRQSKIGAYRNAKTYDDGPLRADDVTGTAAFADWERQRALQAV